jgi:hypothetical protein
MLSLPGDYRTTGDMETDRHFKVKSCTEIDARCSPYQASRDAQAANRCKERSGRAYKDPLVGDAGRAVQLRQLSACDEAVS